MSTFSNVHRTRVSRKVPNAVPPSPANQPPSVKPAASRPQVQSNQAKKLSQAPAPAPNPSQQANPSRRPRPTPRVATIADEDYEGEYIQAPCKRIRRLPSVEDVDEDMVSVPEPEPEQDDNEDDEEEPEPEQDPFIFNEAWVQALNVLNGRTTKAARVKDGFETLYMQARLAVRNMGNYVSFERVLTNGIANANTPLHNRPIVFATEYNDDVEDEQMFEALKKYIPQLEAHIDYLRPRSELIKKLADFLTKVRSKTRSDDLVRLKRDFIQALDFPNELNAKSRRGFKNILTGRLLCPVTQLDKFDEDPQKFCRDVVDGSISVFGADWPVIAYDLTVYDPNRMLSGLLQSAELQAFYTIIFYGPGAALEESSSSKGQPSLAKKYDLTEVTLEGLIYALDLGRFLLNNQRDWYDRDGAFFGKDFVRTLNNACYRHPTYMSKLLKWWTTQIYGNAATIGAEAQKVLENTAYGRLMKQPMELDNTPGAYLQWALSTNEESEDDEEAGEVEEEPVDDAHPAEDEQSLRGAVGTEEMIEDVST